MTLYFKKFITRILFKNLKEFINAFILHIKNNEESGYKLIKTSNMLKFFSNVSVGEKVP